MVINVNRTRPRTRRLVHPNGYLDPIVSWHSRVPCFWGIRSGRCAIGVEDGIFGAQEGEVDWGVGNRRDVLVVEFDEGWVEGGQDGRVDWVEGFVFCHCSCLIDEVGKDVEEEI